MSTTPQWQAQAPPQPPVAAGTAESDLAATVSAGLALSVPALVEAGAELAGAVGVAAAPPLKSVAYQPEPLS